MEMGIILTEADLRSMPNELRDQLLQWHFGRDVSSISCPANARAPEQVPTGHAYSVPLRDDGNRVSFPDFVQRRVLAPGQNIVCRTLKRQQRGGADAYVDAGKVMADGTVEYAGRRYGTPSRLALAVLNANGGSTPAVNGYDYLFLQEGKSHISLAELRRRLPSTVIELTEEESEELRRI